MDNISFDRLRTFSPAHVLDFARTDWTRGFGVVSSSPYQGKLRRERVLGVREIIGSEAPILESTVINVPIVLPKHRSCLFSHPEYSVFLQYDKHQNLFYYLK